MFKGLINKLMRYVPKSWHKVQLVNAYRTVFLDNPAGKLVLYDLIERFNPLMPPAMEESHSQMAYKAGQASVVAFLVTVLGQEVQQLVNEALQIDQQDTEKDEA